MSAVDWFAEDWGDPDRCVHIADNGSDVPDKHDPTSGGEH